MITAMKSCGTIDQNVLKLLKKFPETRTSDMKLCALYYNTFGLVPAGELPLSDLAYHYKCYGLPCFESIRRARQRVQSLFPELSRNPPKQGVKNVLLFITLGG